MGIFWQRSLNLVKLYSWNSIFFKYFRKSIVYILMPLIVLSLIVCFYMLRSHEEDVISERERAFYQTSSVLESIFRDVENNHLVASSSSDVISYCSLDKNTDFKTRYDSMYAVKKLFDNICVSSQYITNIHLYQPNNNYVFSTIGSSFVDDFFIKEWYNIFRKTGVSDFVYYNKSDIPNYYSDSVIIVKALMSDDYLYGIIMYDIHSQTFGDIFKEGGYEQSFQLLCDSEGKIFYSADKNLVGKSISSIDCDIKLENLNGIKKNSGTLYMASDVNLSCRYISASNVNDSRSIAQLAGIVAGISVVVLILSFLLSFYLSLQFYQSIIQITATLRNDEENGEASLSEEKYNELYYINSHIVSRLTKKPDIEKRLAEQIADLKKAQFVALQTQLNPHFIYNTLNLINVMVMNVTKCDSDASRAIIILSQLLREALDTKKYLVSIGDEFEYVEKYIELQKLKFNYDIDIVWDVDEKLLGRKVLKFMLQPIVENAFEHGFGHTTLDEYRLIISAREEGEFLVLSVTNNGKRIEPDMLRSLQDTLGSDAIFEHKGIGLVNVNHRIRLIYGDQYGCSIESDDEKTTIKILLPGETDTKEEF